MSGTDQSTNLSGMLSQIGQTLGAAPEDLADKVTRNMANMSRPEINLEDADSIQDYITWGTRTGQLTEGQASQLQWQALKIKEKQEEKTKADGSAGLVNSYRAMEQQRGQIAGNRERQARAGGDVTTFDANLATLDENLALLNQAIAADPVAAETKWTQDTRAYTAKQREATLIQQEAEAALLAETEEFEAMSNNIVAAVVGGQVDLTSEQGLQMLDKMKLKRPELYEDVITRTSDLADKEEKLMVAIGGRYGTEELTLDAFADFSDPERAYSTYKKQYVTSPRSANQAVAKQLDVILKDTATNGKDKDPDAYKWTGDTYSIATKMAEGSVQELIAGAFSSLAAAEQGLEDADEAGGWRRTEEEQAAYTAAEANRDAVAKSFLLEIDGDDDASKERRAALAAEAVAYLQNRNIKPNAENVRLAVIDLASKKGANVQAPATTNTPAPGTGGLTAEEAAEMAALKRELGIT